MESRCIHCDDLLPHEGDCTRCAQGGRAPEVLPAFLGLDLQLDRRRREVLQAEPPPAIAPLEVPPSLRRRDPMPTGTRQARALTLEALAPPLPVRLPAGGLSVPRRSVSRDEAFVRDALLGGDAPLSPEEEASVAAPDAAVDEAALGCGRTLRMFPEREDQATSKGSLEQATSEGSVAAATASRGLAGLAEALRMQELAERLGIGGLQARGDGNGDDDAAPNQTEGLSDAAVPLPAVLWRRALAWSVDGALVFAVGLFYLGLAYWVTGGVSLQGLLLPAIALHVLVGAVYATVGSLMGGRTLGLRLAGIRLVDGRGQAPAPTVTLARALLGTVSAALLGLGFWLALVDRRGQTLHDKLTSTFIVQAI